MEITEVRIYLAREEQLGGFATVTVDNCLAIHDVKIIEADAAPVYLDALKETQQRHLQGYRSPDEHRGARAHTARGDCGIQKSGGRGEHTVKGTLSHGPQRIEKCAITRLEDALVR